jgi:hypothetical protein
MLFDVRRVAERSGVLIIRAWIEPGIEGEIRVRMTGTRDVTVRGEELTATASSVEQACKFIRAWLEDLAH